MPGLLPPLLLLYNYAGGRIERINSKKSLLSPSASFFLSCLLQCGIARE